MSAETMQWAATVHVRQQSRHMKTAVIQYRLIKLQLLSRSDSGIVANAAWVDVVSSVMISSDAGSCDYFYYEERAALVRSAINQTVRCARLRTNCCPLLAWLRQPWIGRTR